MKNVKNHRPIPAAPRQRPSPTALSVCLRAALGLSRCALAAPARAAEILIQGPSPDVAVTAADLRAELAAAPDQARTQIVADRDALVKVINAIYQRKALVGAAKAAGLAQTPEVQAQVERARDLVYAAAVTQKEAKALNARIPDMTARAAELYQAQPERYQSPPQVRVRHLLLKAETPDAASARRPEAEALLKQLREGADFAELATKTSEDETTASKGGELPAFGRGQMVKPFEEAAFALKQPGDLSPVVASNFGLHLIRLDEIQPGRQLDFDHVKAALIAKLRHDWVVEAQETWRQEIVDPAKAKVDQSAVDAFMAENTKPKPTP